MASTKGRILDFLGRWVLNEGRVVAVDDIGSHFVSIGLEVDPSVPYNPGDKVQIVFPSKSVRTYTPIGWADGRTEVLAHRHGAATPAMAWLDSIAVDQPVRFVGPQRSLTLPPGPVTLIGDETAIGVAAAYARARPSQITPIFEVGPTVDVAPALERVGLENALVVRRGGGTDPALIDTVAAGTQVGIAGGGELVQRVRAQLRARGVTTFKVKTYWLAGRAGLD